MCAVRLKTMFKFNSLTHVRMFDVHYANYTTYYTFLMVNTFIISV